MGKGQERLHRPDGSKAGPRAVRGIWVSPEKHKGLYGTQWDGTVSSVMRYL